MPHGLQIGTAFAICYCLAIICAVAAVYSVFDDGPILFWSVVAATFYLLGKGRRVLQRPQTNT